MIDGVIFDKDGTLFDFRQSWGGWARRLLPRTGGTTRIMRDRLAETLGLRSRDRRIRPGTAR